MAETKRTKGVETDKYSFYTPEDKKAAEKEQGKAWNQKKLKKVIVNDYILSYQELLEMKMIYESQLEDAERDIEILEEKIKHMKEKKAEYAEKVKEWEAEIAQAEADIPEIGEKAAEDRRMDAENQKKHEDNLKGKGEGRALEMNKEGDLVDKTGTKK